MQAKIYLALAGRLVTTLYRRGRIKGEGEGEGEKTFFSTSILFVQLQVFFMDYIEMQFGV